MGKEPHIGNLIKEELFRQGRTITWLARELGYSRQQLYNIFPREWIYTDLLLKISILLKHDIFKQYTEYLKKKEI